ncbi:glycosyltransferase [Myxococcota bacterium]|nr:glycosyltransferase [Myxococcota bacterium]
MNSNSGIETNEQSVRLSVLVPVVERHDDLREIHATLLPELEKIGLSYEVLFLVSAEFGTAFNQAVELHEANPSWVRTLRFARPVSEAAALATGFERAHGEIVITFPSYFDAAPSGLCQLVEALENGADMAFAQRVDRRDRPVKKLQANTFSWLSNLATGTNFRDVASGTRALYRELVSELPLYGDFHRFLPVLAHRVGFRVSEVSVQQDPRASAPTVYHPRVYLWRILDLLSVFFLSHFTRRPLRLFGAVGSAFGLAGALILAWLGVERLLGEPLAGRPVMVLGTLLLGLGVQTFTIGLLGELLLFFQARDVRDYRVAETYECAEPPLG